MPPRIGVVRATFGAPFPASQIAAIRRRGVTPLVELDPSKTPLSQIVAEKWDGYLTSLGSSLADARTPVAIDFAPDPNLRGSAWGCGNVSPATYVPIPRAAIAAVRLPAKSSIA